MTKPARQLPAHIQAAIEQQRNRIENGSNLTDTAGQPWEGRTFEHSMPADTEDDGRADAAFADLLNRWRSGSVDESDVIAGLTDVRLFIAARAVHADLPHENNALASSVSVSGSAESGACSHDSGQDAAAHVGDKAADMMICSLKAPDGRKALPVFTSADLVTAWAADARPIPVDARRLALSCVQDGAQLFVVDPADSGGFVARRPAVWSLAKGEAWTPSYDDPDVASALLDTAHEFDEVVTILPVRGRRVDSAAADGTVIRGGGLGPELECHVFVVSGLTREALQSLMDRVTQTLSTTEVLSDRVDSLTLQVQDAGALR